MDRYNVVEHDLITRFRKPIWGRFIGALQDYHMIEAGDKIAVCISGGKDSLLLAKCLQVLRRHSDVSFDLAFISMNPGYTEENSALIRANCARLDIPLHEFDSDIFSVVETVPRACCHVCASMRRGYLYKEAKRIGCNKIALGHHFDDVVETVLLSMFYGGEYKTMPPKLHSDNFEGMELIRPLYYVRERDIITWRDENHITCLRCACKVTRQEGSGKRAEVKKLLEQLEKETPALPYNIFHSLEHVDMSYVLGYKENSAAPLQDFLSRYDQM